MGNAVKLGGSDTGHGPYPPTPVISASPTGMPLARLGDPLAPHLHSRSTSRGSWTVFIDGKPAARTGNTVSCGGTMISGRTVNIG